MRYQLLRVERHAIGGKNLELIDTETKVGLRIFGQDGYGAWILSGFNREEGHMRASREVVTVERKAMFAQAFLDSEGYDAPDWWHANYDTSDESLAIVEQLIAHWNSIAPDYAPPTGVLAEWEEI